MAAFLTGKRAASGHKVMLCDLSAFFTGNSVGPAVVFQPFKAGGVIRELLSKVLEGVLRHLLHGRLLFLPTMMASQNLPTVKG